LADPSVTWLILTTDGSKTPKGGMSGVYREVNVTCCSEEHVRLYCRVGCGFCYVQWHIVMNVDYVQWHIMMNVDVYLLSTTYQSFPNDTLW